MPPTRRLGDLLVLHASMPIGSSLRSTLGHATRRRRFSSTTSLVAAYREHGHLLATLDPLGLPDWTRQISAERFLRPESHGLSEADMAAPAGSGGPSAVGLEANARGLSNAALLQELRRVYSSATGFQFSHLRHKQRTFLYERVEAPLTPPSDEERRRTLHRLGRATYFEAFCGQKYAGVKRFGLEGCEALIVGLDALVERAAAGGVEHVVMGMPHRGRLNVLAHTLGKPVRQILSEFKGSAANTPADAERLRARTAAAFARFDVDSSGNLDAHELQLALQQAGVEASLDEVMATMEQYDEDGSGALEADEFHGLAERLLARSYSGDVKYHLGQAAWRELRGGGGGGGARRVHIELLPNPSHLEAVNPLVCGKTRAKQHRLADGQRRRCMGVLLHGDAAFSGQGVVFEALGARLQLACASLHACPPRLCMTTRLLGPLLHARPQHAPRSPRARHHPSVPAPPRTTHPSPFSQASPTCTTTRRAARSTSSSTTRSASPRHRESRARRAVCRRRHRCRLFLPARTAPLTRGAALRLVTCAHAMRQTAPTSPCPSELPSSTSTLTMLRMS